MDNGYETLDNQQSVNENAENVPLRGKAGSKEGSQKRIRFRPKPVYFWTNVDVLKFLRRHCADHQPLYGRFFVEHDITGRSLVRLTDGKLEKLGIADKSHREEILREVLKLRLKGDILEMRELEIKGEPSI